MHKLPRKCEFILWYLFEVCFSFSQSTWTAGPEMLVRLILFYFLSKVASVFMGVP